MAKHTAAITAASRATSISTMQDVSAGAGAIVGSRRPSTHDSIGGSTVVGSPPTTKYLPSSPPFTPSSVPPAGSSQGHADMMNVIEERNSFSLPGRRSLGLDAVPESHRPSDEDTEGNSGDDDYEDAREELSGGSSPRTYPERPPSRLARYDDASIFGGGSTYGGNQDGTPPSPEFSLRQRGQAEPGWTDDLVSPDADAPLLSHQSYFMVGDGGFSTGGNGTTTNEGAYDEESYYRAVSYPRVAVAEADRASSPNSERSASPLSYGHGQIGRILPDEERQQQQQQQQQQQHLSPPSTSQTQRPYQHPLAQGIQMAMGRSTIEPPDREIRMLGGVVRRMSTIESFGSHERDLSRRGSAATARTTYTNTRGNSGGNGGVGSSAMVARENTNGSGNSIGAVSVLIGSGSGGGGSGDGGSGSAGQIERTREAEEVGPIVRSSSPTDLSQR
ncbi:hypothetical protein FS842_006944 [Serendipita sp. 407]|nr:hypothetical protein FS842_006944 [Serendipita sp. 407]